MARVVPYVAIAVIASYEVFADLDHIPESRIPLCAAAAGLVLFTVLGYWKHVDFEIGSHLSSLLFSTLACTAFAEILIHFLSGDGTQQAMNFLSTAVIVLFCAVAATTSNILMQESNYEIFRMAIGTESSGVSSTEQVAVYVSEAILALSRFGVLAMIASRTTHFWFSWTASWEQITLALACLSVIQLSKWILTVIVYRRASMLQLAILKRFRLHSKVVGASVWGIAITAPIGLASVSYLITNRPLVSSHFGWSSVIGWSAVIIACFVVLSCLRLLYLLARCCRGNTVFGYK